MMMVIASSEKRTGRFKAKAWLVAIGWFGTAMVAVAVIALFCFLVPG